MRGIPRLRAAGWALALAFFLIPMTTTTPAAACSPNQGGKYVNQVYRLHVPGDRSKYGACRDYGWWSGTSYAGHSNIPKGYWVYAYPYWYVWGQKASAQPQPQPRASNCSPNMNGKYSGQLYRMHVPKDRSSYGTCYDYGLWSGSSYAGHTNIPRGYWVYAYPYWYVWARQGSAQQRKFKSRWDQVGGSWSTGWQYNHTGQFCGHGRPHCTYCPGQSACGTYPSGATITVTPYGAQGNCTTKWRLRCTSVPQ